MEADWRDKHRQDELIATSVVMVTMATIFVVLRCISRFILIKNPGPDDYLIILAILLTIGYLANIFVLRTNHIGFPITFLTLDNMVNFMKATLAIQVMYYANVCCIKTSILFTYLRFAVSTTFRRLCIGTIVLHVAFFFACFVITLAQCHPLKKMWDLTGTVEGSCINTTAFFYFSSAFNIITDIWILILPIKTLRTINRPTREKYALFVIFGVGTFAAVASIVRLHTIYTYTLATDPFRDGILVNLWSVIEVTIAISCASVSALKPIFSRRQRQITRAAMSSSSGGGGYYASRQGSGGLQSQRSWRGPWHARLGSRDHVEKEKQAARMAGQSLSTNMSRSSGDDGPNTMAEAQAYMVQRPRLVALQGGGGGGLEPEPVNTGTSDGSMIIFTPLPPRAGMGNGGGGDEAGLSSSGSFLLLQK